MRKKSIYCVYCKEKNNIEDKKCKKCHKKLDPKENMLLDYLKEHIKDDLKGKTEDKLIDIIKNFIISHLYGTVLTATLIFTVVSGIVTNIDNVEEVTQMPILMTSSVGICEFQNSTQVEKVCKEGYILVDNICKKEEIIPATINYICSEGYTLSGNRCISNENISVLTKEECIAPEGENYLDTRIENGSCLVNVCAGWTDGECSAGALEEIPFTVTEYCPDGTTLINGVCKRTTSYNITYSCEEGTLNDTECLITREETYSLECPMGYILNEECNICVLGE